MPSRLQNEVKTQQYFWSYLEVINVDWQAFHNCDLLSDTNNKIANF